jgi:hypothetical protein
MDTAQTRAWRAEFEAASKRSLETRLNYAFIKTYKPVTASTADYREWCEQNLPEWLGFKRV